jgi:hypothetical protein
VGRVKDKRSRGSRQMNLRLFRSWRGGGRKQLIEGRLCKEADVKAHRGTDFLMD